MIPVMNLEQYARMHGLITDTDVFMHINAGLRSAKQTKTYKRWYEQEILRLQQQASATLDAYNAAMASGEIVASVVTLVMIAAGHEDNPAVQAARRALAARQAAKLESQISHKEKR